MMTPSLGPHNNDEEPDHQERHEVGKNRITSKLREKLKTVRASLSDSQQTNQALREKIAESEVTSLAAAWEIEGLKSKLEVAESALEALREEVRQQTVDRWQRRDDMRSFRDHRDAVANNNKLAEINLVLTKCVSSHCIFYAALLQAR